MTAAESQTLIDKAARLTSLADDAYTAYVDARQRANTLWRIYEDTYAAARTAAAAARLALEAEAP